MYLNLWLTNLLVLVNGINYLRYKLFKVLQCDVDSYISFTSNVYLIYLI